MIKELLHSSWPNAHTQKKGRVWILVEVMTAERKKRIYSIYKGDEFIATGTKNELAELLDVKPETIVFYSTKSHKNRMTENQLVADFLGYEDEFEI